jgi:hypothetical protein
LIFFMSALSSRPGSHNHLNDRGSENPSSKISEPLTFPLLVDLCKKLFGSRANIHPSVPPKKGFFPRYQINKFLTIFQEQSWRLLAENIISATEQIAVLYEAGLISKEGFFATFR